MKIIKRTEIAGLIKPHSRVLVGGFGCCGSPDNILQAIRSSFDSHAYPHSLDLMFISAVGDKQERGINALAVDGLIKSTVGGFYGFCPKLSKMIFEKKIEAHNWPLGIFPRYFSEISYGANGIKSKVGLGSFIDPKMVGGVLNATGPSLLKTVMDEESEYIFYPKIEIDYFILRASSIDYLGNVSMETESASFSSLEQILATKRMGGKIILEVPKIEVECLNKQISIPMNLVDYVFVTNEEQHFPSYGHESNIQKSKTNFLKEKLEIAFLAANCLENRNKNLNFGIGIPALIPLFLEDKETKISVESGLIGGSPLEGMSFGHVDNPLIEVSQLSLFSMYEAEGIDIAYLGFAEIDIDGCINSSRLTSNNWTGVGGFLNIAYSAKCIVFCGLLGKNNKLVDRVKEVTIDLKHPIFNTKDIYLVCEIGVFKIQNNEYTPLKIVNKALLEQTEFFKKMIPV